jgi:hypothetical protein
VIVRVVQVTEKSRLPPVVCLDPALGVPSIRVDIVGWVGARGGLAVGITACARKVHVPPVATRHPIVVHEARHVDDERHPV